MNKPEDLRRPPWLQKKRNISADVIAVKNRIRCFNLHTVCESARCPNLAECFQRGVATIMILGDLCTRNCLFCGVKHGIPALPDPGEGKRIARYLKKTSINYLVITSVTRDDLPDGGAEHYAEVVSTLLAELPTLRIEVLVPDFRGSNSSVELVTRLPITVCGHNLETTKNLYHVIRCDAEYDRSLDLLRTARICGSEKVLIKSGIMVGLGESPDDLESLFYDLAAVKLDILTIGQYLRPSMDHYPVKKYYSEDEFCLLGEMARQAGIRTVKAGPYVRSSYMAESMFESSLAVYKGGLKKKSV